jgi:predicted ATPase
MPFLTRISTIQKQFPDRYPYTAPIVANGFALELNTNVTFLVGENGSGKSTIIEAIAEKIGFNINGGNRNNIYEYQLAETDLASFLRLGWQHKIGEGFFMRAESFFNFATYLDNLEADDYIKFRGYGGKSLHAQSHGESFLSLFQNRFEDGIYILDEPEAALSPQRLLTFMAIMHDLEKANKAQFIIATHSPILLCYPGATIFNVDDGLQKIDYQDTTHYQFTKSFLENPDAYFKHLFDTDE